VSLRVKLILSYIAMAILPLFILVGALGFAFVQVMDQSPFFRGFAGGAIQDIFQNSDYLSRLESRIINEPEAFLKTETLKELEVSLEPFKTAIIAVDASGTPVFASAGTDAAAILYELDNSPGMMERDDGDYGASHVIVNRTPYTVLDRELDGGRLGHLYLVMNMGPVGEVAGKYFGIVGRVTLFLIAVVILLLTWLVSRSMLKSLRQLGTGVRNISEGNLDFEMQSKGKDEVADIVRAFEQMRRRLKSSIDGQLQMEENRRELVANISHDLKTPVTSIKGYVEGLIDGVADTQDKKERYLKTILDKTLVLDRMIEDLFLFSKLDLGRMPFHYETVDARRYWLDLAEETRLDLSERGFEVTCGVSVPEGLSMRLDRHLIRRVQHNLAENAAKYADKPRKTVKLSVQPVVNRLVVTMEDNGSGIPPEELERVFDRFYRADAARTSETGGTGLGLQIARQIVGEHGGDIRLESEVGHFTRVIWTLPLEQPNAPTPQNTPAPPGSSIIQEVTGSPALPIQENNAVSLNRQNESERPHSQEIR
jgi:signal transduction histidine kinase